MPTLEKIMLENGDSQRQGKSKLLLTQTLLKAVPVPFTTNVSISCLIPRVYPRRLSTHFSVWKHKKDGLERTTESASKHTLESMTSVESARE